jgi:hypothetical protein
MPTTKVKNQMAYNKPKRKKCIFYTCYYFMLILHKLEAYTMLRNELRWR